MNNNADMRLIMKRGAKQFGDKSTEEKEVINEILFRRQVKGQSFQKIGDDLNASSHGPRRAKIWTWGLIRHVFVCNTKPAEMKE